MSATKRLVRVRLVGSLLGTLFVVGSSSIASADSTSTAPSPAPATSGPTADPAGPPAGAAAAGPPAAGAAGHAQGPGAEGGAPPAKPGPKKPGGPPPKWRTASKPFGYASGALAVVAGGLGTYFGLRALDASSEYERDPTIDRIEEGERLAAASTLSFISAGILAAASFFILVIHPDSTKGGESPAKGPGPGPGAPPPAKATGSSPFVIRF